MQSIWSQSMIYGFLVPLPHLPHLCPSKGHRFRWLLIHSKQFLNRFLNFSNGRDVIWQWGRKVKAIIRLLFSFLYSYFFHACLNLVLQFHSRVLSTRGIALVKFVGQHRPLSIVHKWELLGLTVFFWALSRCYHRFVCFLERLHSYWSSEYVLDTISGGVTECNWCNQIFGRNA